MEHEDDESEIHGREIVFVPSDVDCLEPLQQVEGVDPTAHLGLEQDLMRRGQRVVWVCEGRGIVDLERRKSSGMSDIGSDWKRGLVFNKKWFVTAKTKFVVTCYPDWRNWGAV